MHCLWFPSASRVGLNMLYADNDGKERKIANVTVNGNHAQSSEVERILRPP